MGASSFGFSHCLFDGPEGKVDEVAAEGLYAAGRRDPPLR